MQSCHQSVTREHFARFTSASLAPPDFGRLRALPEALYWCVQEQDMVRLRPLSSLF